MTLESSLARDHFELSTPYKPPESAVQQALCEIYRGAFGLDRLGIDDDYFELGGDSLIAAVICTEIAAKLQKKIQPGILSRNRTVRKLALKINVKAPESSVLQNIQPGKSGVTPIFILPGNSGYSILRPAFLDTIGVETPVYAFQIPGLSSPGKLPPTIEELAKIFVQAILDLKQLTTFNIMSFCETALVMLHMLSELKELNRVPSRIVFADPGFGLALPYLYEKLRHQGKSVPLSTGAYLRMKYKVLKKLGKWRPAIDREGNFFQPQVPGKYFGSLAHQADIRNHWAANFESAMAASTAYALLIKGACPPPWLAPAYVITSKWYWDGRRRAHVDAARVFIPNARWHRLEAKTHDDLIVKDQKHLAVFLNEILCAASLQPVGK